MSEEAVKQLQGDQYAEAKDKYTVLYMRDRGRSFRLIPRTT